MLDRKIHDDLAAGRYAFVDAGCGQGHSTDFCERRFRMRPALGIDWHPESIEEARRHGIDAVCADLLAGSLPPKCVAYCAAVDFLEHLPDEASAVAALRSLGAAAREFVYIRHPSFEDREYLASLGLKVTWTDWSGHTNMMTVADFERVFASLDWRDYVVVPHMPCGDSRPKAIVPLGAPIDTSEYDSALHGPKPFARFDRTIFGKFDIFVRLDPALDDARWRAITDMTGWEATFDFDPDPNAYEVRQEAC
jgi:SAM-dependent methyltransferase